MTQRNLNLCFLKKPLFNKDKIEIYNYIQPGTEEVSHLIGIKRRESKDLTMYGRQSRTSQGLDSGEASRRSPIQKQSHKNEKSAKLMFLIYKN